MPSDARTDDRIAVLSPREFEVLELASRGLTNLQIAAQLSITDHAVKFHLGSIYRKLDARNRTAAASVFHAARGPQAAVRRLRS